MMYNFDRFTTYKVVNENGEKQYGLFPKNKTKAKQLIGKAKERANWRIEKFTDVDWEEFRNWEAEEEKRLAMTTVMETQGEDETKIEEE